MFRSVITSAIVGVGLLAACPAAYADPPPSGIAETTLGGLHVFSGVAVTQKKVELRGGWLSETLACDQYRRLRVGATLTYVSPNAGRRKMLRGRMGVVRNCHEGRPHFGFRIRAADTVPRPERHHPHKSLACPDGRWKPGSYTFTVLTIYWPTKLRSSLTVNWENEVVC